MTNPIQSSFPKLTMKYDPNVIHHLGLNMYNRLPSSLSELIANAWDADSTQVEICHDTVNGTITIRDDGNGMTFDEIQDHYLSIGRNKRQCPNGNVSSKLGRKVMGRKGIGKFAGLGIANIIEIITQKDGKLTHFQMNYPRMTQTPEGIPYEPEIIAIKDIPTDRHGTEVFKRHSIEAAVLGKCEGRGFPPISDLQTRVESRDIGR